MVTLFDIMFPFSLKEVEIPVALTSLACLEQRPFPKCGAEIILQTQVPSHGGGGRGGGG